MLSITSYASSWSGVSSLAGSTAARGVTGGGAARGADADEAPTVSTLARQLSEAAERAAARDASLTRTQLADKAQSLRQQLFNYSWSGMSSTDKPQSDDPELVARARQASAYVHRQGASNPFAGFSREQLTLIMYDESDAFTIDERFAAWEEHSLQNCRWSQMISAQARSEMDAKGTYVNLFKACIAEYQAAPLIEQVTYPENYAALRQRWIDYWESGGGSGDMAKDAFEVLLRPLPAVKSYSASLSWGQASRFTSNTPGAAYA